jgi:hypothetical protein
MSWPTRGGGNEETTDLAIGETDMKKKLLGLMTAAAIVLMPHTTATAKLSSDERAERLSKKEKAPELGIAAIAIGMLSAAVYTYDKHCETLPQELVDEYIKGLEFDPTIAADVMKGMDKEYRKLGKETFCETARNELSIIKDWRKNRDSTN